MIEPPAKRARKTTRAKRDAATPGSGSGQPAPAVALDPVALSQAVLQLLEPLATLAIARGVSFLTIQDLLKSAFVEAARVAHPGLPPHRMVSRISTTTGINRREVARVSQLRSAPVQVRRSPATRVFTKWLSDPALKGSSGEAMSLPRLGPAPSFEALAQSITRDVHPRSLLDELCRLGLARVEGDTVHALRDAVVPRGDSQRMLGFLANNVGDHLRAAVTNVLSETPPHLEQAVFADDLSQESLDAFRNVMRTQWKLLLAATAPVLQELIDADHAAGRPQDRRIRVGLYTYTEPMAAPMPMPVTEKSEPQETSGTQSAPVRRRATRRTAPKPPKE